MPATAPQTKPGRAARRTGSFRMVKRFWWRHRLALGAKFGSLGGGNGLELVEILFVATDPERRDNLHHPDDDQPDADHECQCDERIERIRQHDDASKDCDDAEEDRPAPSWQVWVTDSRYGRCDAAEDEPDTDPNGQQH